MAIYEIMDGSSVHECTRVMPALSALVNGICGKPLYAFHYLGRHCLLLYLNNPYPRGRPIAELLPGFL